MASKSGITNKILSPVAPLGSCSAFGCVSQNNVLSAMRILAFSAWCPRQKIKALICALKRQLQFYNELLQTKYDGKMAVTLRPRTGYTACEDFFEKMGLNFKIYMQKEGDRIEIADGGFVDWISKLTGDKKDRCLISGLGLERLLSLPEKDH